ncbi:MAG: hypothetical protein JSS82_06015 [Bacteroidetes bacterium]|nr:hypothetical protein [Bacteroidota bacterium]
MTYLEIDEHDPQGKKMLDFLKTQGYITVLDKPNSTTKKAIREARAGKATKAKNAKSLLKEILG